MVHDDKLAKTALLRKVDDTLGVLHTHGVAGAIGGLMTGLLASPSMIVYLGSGQTAPVNVTGLVYGNPHQFLIQALALGVIVAYDAVATFVVIKAVGFLVPLRMPETQMVVGDEAVHGAVAFDLEPVEASA